MNMVTARLRPAALILGLALCTVIPVAAQEYEVEPEYAYDTSSYTPAPGRSAVMKEFESQVAWKALDYWTTQLNQYKSRIDRTVSDCDLAELNRLRVYWSMFLDEKKWEGMIEGVDDVFGVIDGHDSYETYDAVPAPDQYDYTATDTALMPYEYDEQYATDTVSLVPGYPADESEPGDAGDVSIRIEGEYAEEAEIATDAAEPVPATDYDYADEYESYGSEDTALSADGYEWQPPTPEEVEAKLTETLALVDRISEMAETFFVAKWIARRYRPEFDRIRDEMTADTRGFIDTLLLLKENFEREHAAEIAADPEAMQMMAQFTREQAEDAFVKLGSEKTVVMMYNILIEPLLLLYNGQDLRKLLKEVDALPEEITELVLPEMSALRQNVPNPASTVTTIPYVLDEASSRTLLRLYNSRGDLMSQADLGFQSAGEHQAEIDVAKLPAGSYLYHLTVQGSAGERVYSKTMQVVR